MACKVFLHADFADFADCFIGEADKPNDTQ
jgi:hypothetical protein